MTAVAGALAGAALARVTGALASAGQRQQAEALARSITDPDRQAAALARVAGTLAQAGRTRAAKQVAATACATGGWTTAAPAVLSLNPAAFTVLAHVLDIK